VAQNVALLAPLQYAKQLPMSEEISDSKTIDFGYEDVPVGEKRARVREVFDGVASSYDLMNDLMSLGIHRIWKSMLLDMAHPGPNTVLVDVAGGTGDIALGFLERGGKAAYVCDINHEMLKAGTQRREAPGYDDARLNWICGNAESLPLADKTGDVYTITFGIRNVTHRDKALEEARRVLKPGGRFLCLEFSMPDIPGTDKLYDFYSFKVLPWIGEKVAGDADSYRYLAESIRKFPAPEDFAEQIRDAGLGQVKTQALTGGIATLYSAWRL
jgi:demethylmenaquinone methyltransferase/2-methoxy-6-polyprenyl-1,4-benzoquinol methylase